VPRATTVRFTDELFAKLDQASARTGMPVNSILIAACLEWMERHTPAPETPGGRNFTLEERAAQPLIGPRWATISRAMKQALTRRAPLARYPFDRFSDHAKQLLTSSQSESEKAGHSYIGTEHLLLASFASADSYSARILLALGVDENVVRDAIASVLQGKTAMARGGMIPTRRVKRVIEVAFGLCASMGDARVGTHHMLLALRTEGEGIAAQVLADLGVTRDAIAAQISQLAAPEP
jgi:hypothetical protein